MEAHDLKALPDKEENNSGFVVDNDSKATWYMRKIKQMKKKQQENEELAEEQMAEIKAELAEVKAWLDEENGKLDNNIGFMENKLELYAYQLKEADRELKTYRLPFGSLVFRKPRDKWEYDEEKLLDFAEANLADVVKTVKKVDKRQLKKKVQAVDGRAIIKETGEIVEGVKITERPEEFRIDV